MCMCKHSRAKKKKKSIYETTGNYVLVYTSRAFFFNSHLHRGIAAVQSIMRT